MLVESEEKLTGNARFEGFSIELASELSNILGFNFTFKLVDDGKVIQNFPKMWSVYCNRDDPKSNSKLLSPLVILDKI